MEVMASPPHTHRFSRSREPKLLLLVRSLGFEPRWTGSEPAALPLGYVPVDAEGIELSVFRVRTGCITILLRIRSRPTRSRTETIRVKSPLHTSMLPTRN